MSRAEPEQIRLLSSRLRGGSTQERRDAALRLGRFGEQAVSELIAALGDSDTGVRARAAFSLARVGSVASLDALAGRLQDQQEDPEVRLQAAVAIGRVKHPRATEALVAALGDPSEEIRALACQGLGNQEDSGTARALTPLLEDSSPDVRLQAAIALAKLSGRPDGTGYERPSQNSRDWS